MTIISKIAYMSSVLDSIVLICKYSDPLRLNADWPALPPPPLPVPQEIYEESSRTGQWHREVLLGEEGYVVLHSPGCLVHHPGITHAWEEVTMPVRSLPVTTRESPTPGRRSPCR